MDGNPGGICGAGEHTNCRVTGERVAQAPRMIATMTVKPR